MPPELTLVAPAPVIESRATVDVVEPETAAPRTGTRRRKGALLFIAFLALYTAVGAVLVFHYGLVLGDAISRVANAYYVVSSRHPHLGAIGFVWSPLPSLAVLPLLPLKTLWPALTAQGFAGNLMSAAFMAGAVCQVRALLRALGLGTRGSLLLAVCFGLHPAIVYYGANGMSEAPFIFLLLAAGTFLARWVENGELRTLAATGFALALAYLTRYEAIFAALAVMAAVAMISYRRAGGGRRARRDAAVADTAIVGAPFLLAFVLWTASSWMIVGHPFEQFSSAYGVSSQLQLDNSGITDTWRSVGKPRFILEQQLALQPLFPVLLVGAGIASLRRRDPRILAPLAAIGGALGFQVLAFLTGRTWGSLRYQILAVPLSVVVAGVVLVRAGPRPHAGRVWPRRIGAVFVAAIVVSSLPSGAMALLDRRLAPDESAHLQPVVHLAGATAVERFFLHRYRTEQEIARYVDSLRLPPGKILLDTFNGYAIVLASSRPQQFVVTSDPDFKQFLGEPALFGVDYLLVSSPAEWGGALDAINRTFDNVYETGAGIATLEREFHNPGWRLYRLDAVDGVSGPPRSR